MPSQVRSACRSTMALAVGDMPSHSAMTAPVFPNSSRYPACATGGRSSHRSSSTFARSPRGPASSPRSEENSLSASSREARGQSVASSNVSAMRNKRYATETVLRVGSGNMGMANAKVRLVFASKLSRSTLMVTSFVSTFWVTVTVSRQRVSAGTVTLIT